MYTVFINSIIFNKRILLTSLFLTLFILPHSVLALSSAPCFLTANDCPKGPIAGLSFTKATDQTHFGEGKSKELTCMYGSDGKTIEIKYLCFDDEATAKLESEYNNFTKERPQTGGFRKLSTRRKDPCEIPVLDSRRCRASTYVDRYLVNVLGGDPWLDGYTRDMIPASEARAMERAQAALVAAKKDFHPKEAPAKQFKGRAYSLDVLRLEEPVPLAKLTLTLGGKKYETTADENGEYVFDLDSTVNEVQGTLTLTLMGEKDGKDYFEVVDDSVNTDSVEISRNVNIKNDTDFVIDLVLGNEYESESDRNKVRGLTSKYYELFQAIDFAERVLKIDVTKLRGDDMLPISLYAYDKEANSKDSSFYTSDFGVIRLDDTDSKFYTPDGPFTVFHEFGHHIMHTFYTPVVWNTSLEQPGYTAHAGILNSNTADSLGEGYATFFALLTAQAHGYTYPHPYSPSPVMYGRNWEVNIPAWYMEGSLSREELAVASLLYDLVDKHSDTGDDIEMSINSLIEVMQDDAVQTVKALYDKLITIEDKVKIDALFVEHGFFWDKKTGDNNWNFGTHAYTNPDTWETCTTTASEPHQDTNNDGLMDPDVDRWMDYGNWNEYPCVPVYNEGDEIGFTGSYQTNARESFAQLPNRFMEVNNGTYRQEFTFPNNPEYDYVLTHEVTNNMLPVVFPPAQYNATVKIAGSERNASETTVLSTEEYQSAITSTAGEGVFKSVRTEKGGKTIPFGWIVIAIIGAGALFMYKKRKSNTSKSTD